MDLYIGFTVAISIPSIYCCIMNSFAGSLPAKYCESCCKYVKSSAFACRKNGSTYDICRSCKEVCRVFYGRRGPAYGSLKRAKVLLWEGRDGIRQTWSANRVASPVRPAKRACRIEVYQELQPLLRMLLQRWVELGSTDHRCPFTV